MSAALLVDAAFSETFIHEGLPCGCPKASAGPCTLARCTPAASPLVSEALPNVGQLSNMAGTGTETMSLPRIWPMLFRMSPQNQM